MTATNRQYVLSTRPAHLAGPDNFDLRHAAVPDPAEGEALVAIEMVALSAWQGMRAKEFRNFIRPFDIGELISCDAYGTVVQSRCQALPHGTAVVGRLGWQDYALVTPDRVDVAGPDHSAEEWLTALSSPGQTPYLAFSQKARPMPGDTLVVTSAAGAVASYAVQLGKLAGMRVVGIVGSADKADFVTGALGADAAVSYKAPDFAAQHEAACPDGVDLFFDTCQARRSFTS